MSNGEYANKWREAYGEMDKDLRFNPILAQKLDALAQLRDNAWSLPDHIEARIQASEEFVRLRKQSPGDPEPTTPPDQANLVLGSEADRVRPPEKEAKIVGALTLIHGAHVNIGGIFPHNPEGPEALLGVAS